MVKELNLKQPIGSAQAAANYFLELAEKEHRKLTPMQLIKLVYIAHGWTLALMNRPLFDERVQAWQHGPVIPSLYHEFKHFGSNPVDEMAMNLDFDGQLYYPKINATETVAKKVLNKVWDVYKGYSGTQLRALCHQTGSPWQGCYKVGQRNIEIDPEAIRHHYVHLLGGMVAPASASVEPKLNQPVASSVRV